MATFGDTQAAVVESQVWDSQILQSRYAKSVIMNRVLNRSALVSEAGQIVHIPIKPKYAGGTVGTDGGFTPENQTITEAQVNVNTWKYVAIEVTDKAQKQSVVTLETEMPSQFGEKLSTFSEIDLANLFTAFTGGSPTTSIGSASTPVQFIEDAALNAVLQLRRNDIPLEDLSWILPPEAFYLGWLTKERMTNAMTTGEAKSVLTTNFRQKILNIPAYESTLLSGSVNNANASLNGGIAGGLVHKEAVAIVMQQNNKYERVRSTPAGRLATLVVASNLYGVIGVRADHAITVYIKNS